VNKETVYAPMNEGGRNLRDIVTRNDAISITWLKLYLPFGEEHSLWAFVTDEILSVRALGNDQNVAQALRLNPYLQDWKPTRTQLSDDLKRMIDVGRKYGVQLEGIAIGRTIQRDMVIWYHKKSEVPRTLFNRRPEVECLRKNHKMRLVGEAKKLALRIGSTRRIARRNCNCTACTDTRRECRPRRCANPHKCYVRAQAMLDSLEGKWNPMCPQPEDYEGNQQANDEQDPDIVEFNPIVTTHGTITDVFRIFTQMEEEPEAGKKAPDTKHPPDPDADPIMVYTDGSASKNGTEEARAGIFYGADDIRNRAVKVPNEWEPSNQVGEILAIKETVEDCPKDVPLQIISDSKYAIEGLTKNFAKWENEGFRTVSNGELVKLTVAKLTGRKAHTTFKWVKGHSSLAGNEGQTR
jgi:ribonuclease HI